MSIDRTEAVAHACYLAHCRVVYGKPSEWPPRADDHKQRWMAVAEAAIHAIGWDGSPPEVRTDAATLASPPSPRSGDLERAAQAVADLDLLETSADWDNTESLVSALQRRCVQTIRALLPTARGGKRGGAES